MEMDRISEAILEKVKTEAQGIIEDAKSKALEILEQARQQYEASFERKRNDLIREAEGEAARILARASIQSRQELATAKAQVLDEIMSKVKEHLSTISATNDTSLSLIKESIQALGVDKVVVYVSPKDVDAVRKIAGEDSGLAGKVKEVRGKKCLGGVIVEDTNGKNRIDNTYDARLEKLMPQVLPEISKQLFKT